MAKITNLSKKKIIARDYKLCVNFWSKFRGLMFSRQKNLVFVLEKEKKESLHMWFVFFPIDVVFLDGNKKVVEIKKNFMPFSLYFPKKKAKYILELLWGSVKEEKINIGDKIKF